MLDRDTVIHAPTPDEPRVRVTLVESWATITLLYPGETGLSGSDQPVEVRLTPPPAGDFEPWHLAPRLPLYYRYARAAILWEDADAVAAMRALRDAGATRRGLSDDFYRCVADSYQTLVAAGERHPVATLAEMQPVDISTASRWIKEARRRGYLPEVAPAPAR